jgi:hypothetical protein
MRSLLIAASSPGGEHRQNDYFASVVRQLDGLPLIAFESEIRDMAADLVRTGVSSIDAFGHQRNRQSYEYASELDPSLLHAAFS